MRFPLSSSLRELGNPGVSLVGGCHRAHDLREGKRRGRGGRKTDRQGGGGGRETVCVCAGQCVCTGHRAHDLCVRVQPQNALNLKEDVRRRGRGGEEAEVGKRGMVWGKRRGPEGRAEEAGERAVKGQRERERERVRRRRRRSIHTLSLS